MIHIPSLSIDEASRFVGGFSSILSSSQEENNAGSNNCKGGNCSASSCKKVKRKPAPGPNGNCKGNCVSGCGSKH